VIETGDEPAGTPELLTAVAAWCAAHQVRTDDLRLASRTLEDVFLELTGRGLRR
jgi:ABC-2 type transport system ATP-binding protein